MTPATNAIVGSLPRAKQGVASAVNDTARELGSAFGIAILGSAFNSGYRSHIDGNLQGLPPAARAAAHEAPAAAIAVAQKLGASGDALAAAARDAFMVGSRYAMWIGAVLLVVGAVFVSVRGQQQVAAGRSGHARRRARPRPTVSKSRVPSGADLRRATQPAHVEEVVA